MDNGIIILIILITSMIGCGVLYYLQQNKQVQKLEKVEDFEQVPEIREDKVDWSITQHIGWLYKNGDNKNFDNMNLYFDQSNATFFAMPLEQELRINLNIEMARKGESVELNGEKYVIVFPEQKE